MPYSSTEGIILGGLIKGILKVNLIKTDEVFLFGSVIYIGANLAHSLASGIMSGSQS